MTAPAFLSLCPLRRRRPPLYRRTSSLQNHSSPEYIYTLTVVEPATVSIALSNEEAGTDVVVLADDGLGCNPASCLGFGFTEVTFDALPGVDYYIVIDGYNGAVGSFDLKVTCN